ncbi:MAG: hypothetical protein EPO40_21540 [Myxococcaceae bacterium]|nr:MAG: hypothetical protein EPO40_21540 [Myxococcaceae bacterium]
MDPSLVLELAGVSLVLLGLTIELHARFSRAGRARHAATRAPRSTIARAPTGTTVTLVGRVRFARSTLVSPLTERRCCYYVMAPLATWMGYGDANPSPAPLAREEEGCAFILDDGTGLATVRVGDVALMDYPSCLRQGSDAQQQAMLQQRGLTAHDDWSLHEWTVGEGDLVAVSGVVRDRVDTSSSVDAATGYRVRLREVVVGPPHGLPLVLRHHPGGVDTPIAGPVGE